MLAKLKKFASHPWTALAGGVVLGLALATTVAGAAVTAKFAELRTKAGI